MNDQCSPVARGYDHPVDGYFRNTIFYVVAGNWPDLHAKLEEPFIPAQRARAQAAAEAEAARLQALREAQERAAQERAAAALQAAVPQEPQAAEPEALQPRKLTFIGGAVAQVVRKVARLTHHDPEQAVEAALERPFLARLMVERGSGKDEAGRAA